MALDTFALHYFYHGRPTNLCKNKIKFVQRPNHSHINSGCYFCVHALDLPASYPAIFDAHGALPCNTVQKTTPYNQSAFLHWHFQHRFFNSGNDLLALSGSIPLWSGTKPKQPRLHDQKIWCDPDRMSGSRWPTFSGLPLDGCKILSLAQKPIHIKWSDYSTKPNTPTRSILKFRICVQIFADNRPKPNPGKNPSALEKACAATRNFGQPEKMTINVRSTPDKNTSPNHPRTRINLPLSKTNQTWNRKPQDTDKCPY